MGLALFNKGDLKTALLHFKKALHLNPQLTAARNNIGLVYIKQENYDAAINELREAIALRSNSAETHYNLAVAYNKTGRFEEALSQYTKTLTLQPDFFLADYGLAQIYYDIKKDNKNALIHFKRYLSAHPGDPEIKNIIAQIDKTMFPENNASNNASITPSHEALTDRSPVAPTTEDDEYIEREFDTNNDRIIDLWHFYNDAGTLIKKKIDTNFDGEPDKEEVLK